jgi:hypothetical protein
VCYRKRYMLSDATMERMLALEFFSWWYSQGWVQLLRNIRRRMVRTSHLFSLPVLVRTLFAPWKRIITDPGAGLDAHVRAATDNFVSRLIGFCVRLMVLFTAGLILLFVGISAVVELILWPLIPLAVLFAIWKVIV